MKNSRRFTNKFDNVAFIFKRAKVLFLCLFAVTSASYAQTPDNSLKQIEELNAMFSRIAESNSYVEDLDYNEEEAIHLPIGMKRTIGGMEITIAVNRFALQYSETELGVYAKAVIPQGTEGKRTVLFFGAEGIKGTHSGGLIGELKLSLLHDVEIPFNGGNTKIVLKGNGLDKNRGTSESNTFMTVGCNGFQNLSIDAEVHFPTSLIVRAGEQHIEEYNQDPSLSTNGNNSSEQVIGRFKTVIDSWDDLLVSVNLPNFEIKGLKDYVFSLDHVILDFSSRRNAEDIRFPAEYEQNYLLDEQVLWRGVYAENVSITMPEAFSRASFSAKGLLIDAYGITGLFAADSILPLDKGSADGWRFSVEHFALNLLASELVAAEFNGRIGLPFEGKNTTLEYEGYLLPHNEYLMRVKNEGALDFSIFKAKAHLEKNSNVTLHLVDNRFIPQATLHGYMTVGMGEYADSTMQTAFDKISFRNLKLTTVAPYISAEYFGYEGEAKIGNFPLSISKIALNNSATEHVKLTLGANINLGKDLFSGATELSLLANYEDKKWKFERIEVNSIAVDAVIAGVMHLDGRLNWHRGDAVYGDGFAGDVKLGISFNGEIKKGDTNNNSDKISILARAAFGRKDDFRYWYADGMATFHPGVPIVGMLTLNGIGGALTSGVRAEGRSSSGGRFTNANYIPDASMGLGFKASTVIEVSKAVYGEAAFEMVFSEAGGLASAGFYGYAEFPNRGGGGQASISKKLENQQQTFPANLSEQFKQNDWTKLAEDIKSIPNAIKDMGLSGTLCIQMDFQNRMLLAKSDVYLNTPSNFIRGLGEQGQAGWGVLHIDPKEWYLHLGTPSHRLGVQLAVGNTLAVKTGSYFMAGNRIPEMPAPPRAVAEILGHDLDGLSRGRDENMLKDGNGLAFGSELAVRTGDIQFMMMYANFNAGLGFDVMLKDYAQTQCRGRSGTMGMDGWYAKGKTYAYLQGELGVKVKLWFIRTRVPVIKGGTAALLEAGLPDPTYFKGYLSVNLDVLGLIKGKARFKLSIGEECDMVTPGNSPIEESMINDLSPAPGEQEVSVFTVPQATFNIAMGKSFEATNDAGESAYYRINLEDFIIKDDAGNPIPGELIWGKEKTDVRFQSKEILPPNTTLTAEVRVAFEELKDGVWKPVITSGKPAFEEKIHHFTTGGAPNDIPLQNIVYAYPVIGQAYMLPKEYNKGYVQLQFGQKYLFEKGYDYKLYFVSEHDKRIGTDFIYNEAENRLEFSIPDLKLQTGYALDLSYRTAPQNTNMPKTNTSVAKTVEDEDFTGQIGGSKAQATLSDELEQSILTYAFTTSLYATFEDKMKNIKVRDDVALDAGVALTLGADVQSKEAFDEAEVTGVEKTQYKPLLSLHSELKEDYFADIVYPLVYDGYPYGEIRLLRREEQPFGVPPYKAFSPSEKYLSALNAQAVNLNRFRFPFTFEAALVSFIDFRDLQNTIINSRNIVAPQIYSRFAGGTLPILKKGEYQTTVSYVLPDGTITSSVQFIFTNPLNLNK
ncbi:MAG: hypothetical protein IJT04_02945 [Bacteroidales bacterium]|nr:hypothetical protein [Bacteroidales bacterium]